MGFMARTTQQFHWLNHGYGDFDAFLAQLSSRKRKTIRKERRQAQDFGGAVRMLTGDEIEPHHWDAFWTFYQDTGARKWGMPYLTRAFFDLAHERLRDDILLVLAEREGRAVAGAMNLIGREALYGRYWGCTEHHPCLHFELCYYRAIDFAIAHGLARVEAGAQGEHKLARGYLPHETHSLHFIPDPGFAQAIAQYLEAERVGGRGGYRDPHQLWPLPQGQQRGTAMTEKLSDTARKTTLEPLLEAGWKMMRGATRSPRACLRQFHRGVRLHDPGRDLGGEMEPPPRMVERLQDGRGHADHP
jgi:predicted N-acyltransferase